MRLQGKRRLRSPKLKITPRKPRGERGDTPAAAAPKPKPAPEPPKAPDPEPPVSESAPDTGSEDEEGTEEAVSWSPRMRKDELRAVAEGIGIEVPDDWTKDQIISALEASSE